MHGEPDLGLFSTSVLRLAGDLAASGDAAYGNRLPQDVGNDMMSVYVQVLLVSHASGTPLVHSFYFSGGYGTVCLIELISSG